MDLDASTVLLVVAASVLTLLGCTLTARTAGDFGAGW